MSDSDVTDIIDAQIEAQGVSCLKVDDGHVLTFTKEMLEQLLSRAEKSGRVVLFIQHGALN